MAQPQRGFAVEEIPDLPDNVAEFPQPSPTPPPGQQAAIAGLLIGLKALSQGSAIALGHIARHVVALATAMSVFWLWMSIPDPNQNQIVALGMYAGFVLAVNALVRRK